MTTAYGLNHYFINQKLILARFPKAAETIENEKNDTLEIINNLLGFS